VPHFGRRRIRAVVADDSSDWRSVVAALLKMEDDVEVVAQVENGQEAIEAVTVLHPELAIIDSKPELCFRAARPAQDRLRETSERASGFAESVRSGHVGFVIDRSTGDRETA
jgi:DNA-binding NarL/FixJ family response regulator